MTLRSEVARLKAKALAAREEREKVCTCARLIIIEGVPTPEQQRDIDALIPCKVHPFVVRIVEVGRALEQERGYIA